MLNLYVAPSSASSRKAKLWLNKHHLVYKKRNIAHYPLNANEICQLLSMTDNGFSDIISTRSNIYHKLIRHYHINFDSLTSSHLIALIVKYPNLLRRPIIFSHNKLEIGYNREEIRKFLPQSVRRAELKAETAKLDKLESA